MTDRFDLGILGGGQLARMSIQAAQRMGLRCLSLDPDAQSPAAQIATSVVGALQNPAAIAEVFARCERVTLENEFIPADAIREALRLSDRLESVLMPGLNTLAVIQDKLLQRQAYAEAGVSSPPAFAIKDSPPHQLHFPMVLKSRFGGYDGKGTRYARTPEEFESHRGLWETGGWLAEAFVPFERELAVMVFVGRNGQGAFPTMETVQTEHVCDLVFPADVDAREIALQAVHALGGRGLFGVELFERANGDWIVNEIAPRPHNTGHYTLDWGGVSQFEQHVRLALDLPLGDATGREVCMANLLGQAGAPDWRRGVPLALVDPTVRFHWYGKAEAKPGRKMGHLNVLAEGAEDEFMVDRAIAARDRFYEGWIS